MNRVYKWYLRMHNSNYAFIRRFIEVMLHIIFSCGHSARSEDWKKLQVRS